MIRIVGLVGVTQIGIAAPVTVTVMLLFTVATVTFTLLNVFAFEGDELMSALIEAPTAFAETSVRAPLMRS